MKCPHCSGFGCPQCGLSGVLTEFVPASNVQIVCTNCGHIEAHHETAEYRGDKPRHCLYAVAGHRCTCKRFTAEPQTVRVSLDDLEQLLRYVEWNGAVHTDYTTDEGTTDDCPADDTCCCEGKPINAAINRLCRVALDNGRR